MIYFTSDFHFGRSNIIRFCNRPFFSKYDMDEELIQRFNSCVSDDDDVYILGDIADQDADGYIKRLNGRKHLITGCTDGNVNPSLFQEITDYKELRYGDTLFVLSHRPLEHWTDMEHGSYMLHGHTHTDGYENLCHIDQDIHSLDIGVDANDYFPVPIDSILAWYQPIDITEIEEINPIEDILPIDEIPE